jgi:hypothetical protein
MRSVARRVHLGAAWLFVAGVVVQGYLAGAALVQLGGSGDFGTHIAFGNVVMGTLSVVVPIFAMIGRLPRSQVGSSFLLLVLYVLQTSFPYFRASSPAIAALHPANAMVMLVLGIAIAIRARRLGFAGA